MKQHDFKTGDILHHSWGYDQTNADFYQVLRVSDKSIWIVQIESTETVDGYLCGKAQPISGKTTGKVLRKVPYQYGSNYEYYQDKWFVRINDYTAGAERWNGELISVTHYA